MNFLIFSCTNSIFSFKVGIKKSSVKSMLTCPRAHLYMTYHSLIVGSMKSPQKKNKSWGLNSSSAVSLTMIPSSKASIFCYWPLTALIGAYTPPYSKTTSPVIELKKTYFLALLGSFLLSYALNLCDVKDLLRLAASA